MYIAAQDVRDMLEDSKLFAIDKATPADLLRMANQLFRWVNVPTALSIRVFRAHGEEELLKRLRLANRALDLLSAEAERVGLQWWSH